MRNDSQTRHADKRSVADTLIETLTQTGRRPAFTDAGGGLRARSRRLALVWAALAVAAAAALVVLSGPRAAMPEVVAVVELVRGPAATYPASGAGDASRPPGLAAARPIHAGAVIDTGHGTRVRATARLTSGPSVRLDAGTRVRWMSNTALELERGAVYVDSERGPRVEIRTALGIVRDVGTQFEVRLTGDAGGEALRVRVRQGSIELDRGGETYVAAAGVELAMDASGVLTRSSCPTYGPSWEWVLDVAPAPWIEGMSLEEFLEWACHEGGWQLRFADRDVAARASEIVLHGNVQGLRLAEAAAAVFRGSELTYRIDGGVLLVAASGHEFEAEGEAGGVGDGVSGGLAAAAVDGDAVSHPGPQLGAEDAGEAVL